MEYNIYECALNFSNSWNVKHWSSIWPLYNDMCVCKYNDKYVYRYEFDTLSSAFKKNPFFMYGWMYTFIEYEVFCWLKP